MAAILLSAWALAYADVAYTPADVISDSFGWLIPVIITIIVVAVLATVALILIFHKRDKH